MTDRSFSTAPDGTQDAHTPTPWMLGRKATIRTGLGRSPVYIATLEQGSDRAANGAFIVQAANCHDDLVALLKVFLGEDNRFQVSVGGNPIAIEAMLDFARATLKAAEQ